MELVQIYIKNRIKLQLLPILVFSIPLFLRVLRCRFHFDKATLLLSLISAVALNKPECPHLDIDGCFLFHFFIPSFAMKQENDKLDHEKFECL